MSVNQRPKALPATEVLIQQVIAEASCDLLLQGKDSGKNDLTRRVTHRAAGFRPVIHSIFGAWHYEVLWTCALTRLL